MSTIMSYPTRAKALSVIVEFLIGASGIVGMIGFASTTIALAGSTGIAISFGLAVCGVVGIISRIVDYDEVTIIVLRMQAAIYFVWSLVLVYYSFGFSNSGLTKPNLQGVGSLLIISTFNLLVAHALVKGIKREKDAVVDFKTAIGLSESGDLREEDHDGL